MTSVQLLSGLRTLLDEAQEGFWLDAECYVALTEGQKEYAAQIFFQYKNKALINLDDPLPEVLKSLYTEKTDNIINTNYFTIPTDLWYDLSVYLGTPYLKSFFRREAGRNASLDENNPYSQGDFYSIKKVGTNNSIVLEITSQAAPVSYNLRYLKLATDISAAIEPILPEFTHKSFIIYAFAELLKKSKQYDTSASQLKEFYSLIKYV